MHTSNLQISLIKGQLSQLNSQLDATNEAIEGHFQSVIDEIIEEVNLQKEKTLRGADNRQKSSKNQNLYFRNRDRNKQKKKRFEFPKIFNGKTPRQAKNIEVQNFK